MTPDYKPETVWDVCELTAEAIEARPLNYYQGRWAVDAKNYMPLIGPSEESKEACGTAFCRAGWMCSVAGTIDPSDPDYEDWDDSIPRQAKKMLLKAGVPTEDINSLFAGLAIEIEKGWRAGDLMPGLPQPGTEEYAKLGAEGMRKFMAKWETQLKAANLKDIL